MRSLSAITGLVLAAAGPAVAQETSVLDSLARSVTGLDYRQANYTTQRSYDFRLDLMMEQELVSRLPFQTRFSSLDGYWQGLRSEGLTNLWNKSNYDFLAKPEEARTGEGLIPDIQVPLPGLERVLGTGAQVKINGNQKISMGGEQTLYPNSKITSDLIRQRSNFDLKIKQEQRINLEGVIGDRIHVLIDHDSQAEIDKKSTVKLRYEGKEDEVVQRLEAGDTEFSISGSSLVGGLTTVHKGLFGLKGVARLGGLELSAIASKDEGKSQTNSFSGQNRRDSLVVQDIDYIRHRFFWLKFLEPGDSIVQLRVYATTAAGQGSIKWVRPLDMSWTDFNVAPGRIDSGYPIKVEEKFSPQDFVLERQSVDARYLPSFYLRNRVGDDENLAIACWYRRGGKTVYYPDSTAFYALDSLDRANVSLIKPSNCLPPNGTNGYAWHYELRNAYDLRARQIVETSLNVKLQKNTGDNYFIERDTQRDSSTFIHLMGIDGDEDGKIDPAYYRLGDEGYFYFPDIQPFADSVALSEPNPIPYIKSGNQLEPSDSKYRFVITYLTADATFYLQAPGRIIEGSVKVYLNGQLLDESKYTMDYDSGIITFRESVKQEINKADASLKIDYQYYPMFALGSKTLAGIRGLYKFNEQSHLGGTWMYRSEQTPEDKPRLGEEPRRIIVAGLDGAFQVKPEVLTRLVDALPLVETEAASSISFSGEVATNFPNPNTKGHVYVDDMDGAKVSDDFSLERLSWVRSGVPYGKLAGQLAGQFYWYNPTNQVVLGELNPDLKDENEKRQTQRTLKLHIVPDSASGRGSWAGITTLLSSTGMDFTERRLLNIWVRGDRGRLHVDIGQDIDLDQVRRNASSTIIGPDGIINGEPPDAAGAYVTTNTNDIGIDGIATGQSGDDGNDDFIWNDSTRMNGTEGNGRYDSEDMKLGSDLGAPCPNRNNYYSFDCDLSDPDVNSYGWHKYAIPLGEARPVGSIIGWNNIFYTRVWVDSLTEPTDVELALLEVTGNRWLSQGIGTSDTLLNPVDTLTERFELDVKNNRDNEDYSSDPPYAPEKDEQGNIKFEQSLTFRVSRLDSGHLASARHSLRQGENNYTGYRNLRLYVKSRKSCDGDFFVRLIANDSASYYEYREPLTNGWRDVPIELDQFSNLKKLPATASGIRQQGNFRMRGSPSLTQLSRVALGIETRKDISAGDSIEVWFDDLRLDDVRRDRGTALVTSVNIGLADLMSLGLSYRDVGSHWYSINDQGRGSGSRSVSYGVNTSLNLHKIFLDKLGLTVPLTYSQGISRSYPEFGRDDIRLSEAESRAEASWSKTQNAGLTIAKRQSNFWLSNLTIDRLSPNFSWSRSVAENPTAADSNTSFQMGLGYSWSPRARQGLKLFRNNKLYFLPSSITWSWGSTQSKIWHWDRLANVKSTLGSGASRSAQGQFSYQPLDQVTYTFGTQRNLMQNRMAGYWAKRLGLGSEISRNQKVDFRTTLSWLRLIRPSCNYTVQYNESHQIYWNSDRQDSVDVQGVSNANSVSLTSDLALGKWLAKVTGLRNEARDTSAEPGSPRWAVINFDKFFKRWNGLSVNFSQAKSNNASGLLDRPGLLYQIGFIRQPQDIHGHEIQRFQQATGDRNTLQNSYSSSSQASFGNLILDAAWRRSDDWNTAGGTTSYTQTTVWPDLTANLMSLEKLKVWRRAMASSNVTSKYTRTLDRSEQLGRGLLRQATKHALNASWNGRWTTRVHSDITVEYSLQKTKEPSQDYLDGFRLTSATSQKLSTSLSYAFSAPKGVILNFGKLGKKRIRFTSDLNIQCRASYSVRGEKNNSRLSAELKESRNSQEFSVAPSATYNFSRSINGNINFEYAFNKDKLSDVNNWKRYNLNASVNILF